MDTIVALARKTSRRFLRISMGLILVWIGGLKFVDPSPVVGLLEASFAFLASNPVVYLRKQIPIAGVAHQNGTCRFGTDRRRSVLDLNCKAHDLDNLYVVDASFFPSSTSSNPSLTIIAHALRVGDHLPERLGAANPVREAVTADGRS